MTDSNADYYENDDCYEDDGSELIEDEDIVDLEDDDEPCEDLDQRMKRLDYDLGTLEKEYQSFTEWLNGSAPNVIQKGRNKAANKLRMCLYVIKMMKEGNFVDDILKLWCICFSDNSDFVFDVSSDPAYCLFNFMGLKEDFETYIKRLTTERAVIDKAKALIENFTFADKPCIEFDEQELYEILHIHAEITGKCFEDNFKAFTKKIVCSPELSQIIPVAYYALLTRYRRKLLEGDGYEANFSKLLRYISYNVHDYNGKNALYFFEHVGYFAIFNSYFKRCGCDPYLSSMAFSCICNIFETDLVCWEEFPNVIRPFMLYLKDETFVCDIPNPFRLGISDDDIIYFEETDSARPAKKRIIPVLDSFMEQNYQVCEKYIDMAINGKEKECTPLIIDVIGRSGIDTAVVKPEQINVLHYSVVNSMIRTIDKKIKSELMSLAAEHYGL